MSTVSAVKTPELVLAPEKTAEEQGTQELLRQLADPEVQASLRLLLDHLPELTQMMVGLSKTYDLTQKVASDRILRHDVIGAVNDVWRPLEAKAKHIGSAVIEAQERAADSTEQVGFFGMLKMLKSPEVQGVFRFCQAFLNILGERKAAKGEEEK
jgi:uncharacterized protein YjgD (DUF1641 family)